MPEFTLELDRSAEPVVEAFTHDLNDVLRDPTVPAVFGTAVLNGDFLTVEIETQWPRLTIYFGVLLLVAGGFGMIAFNAAWWTLLPGFAFTFVSIAGSSYWWAYVWVIPRLRKRGYTGRIRLAHAEGVF